MNPFINIHTHRPVVGQFAILNLSRGNNEKESSFYSFGIHPWDIRRTDVELHMAVLEQHCIQKKIIAVGETGLDKAIQTSLEIQQKVFDQQARLAEKYNLPIIIHCVRAWNEILELRKSGSYKTPWIFHGFNSTVEVAKQIIMEGGFLSFSKALIHSAKLQKTLCQIPLNSIFFETDDDELKVEDVYKKAHEILEISLWELTNRILENFNRVFKPKADG